MYIGLESLPILGQVAGTLLLAANMELMPFPRMEH
jgi:hypothetical protein